MQGTVAFKNLFEFDRKHPRENPDEEGLWKVIGDLLLDIIDLPDELRAFNLSNKRCIDMEYLANLYDMCYQHNIYAPYKKHLIKYTRELDGENISFTCTIGEWPAICLCSWSTLLPIGLSIFMKQHPVWVITPEMMPVLLDRFVELHVKVVGEVIGPLMYNTIKHTP